MTLEMIINLILGIVVLLVLLYGFVVISKLLQVRNKGLSRLYRLLIEREINMLLYSNKPRFGRRATAFIDNNLGKMKHSVYRSVLETLLLNCIEDVGGKSAEKAMHLAYGFGFPSRCVAQIKSRRSATVSRGCQKAGLYRYAEAVPAMLNALSNFSSDTQMDILIALSMIGDLPALTEAFDKIQRRVFINERGVSELMSSFSGDRQQLYQLMIWHNSNYIAALFLKAMDRETAITLKDELLQIISEDDKEKRIAAMKALSKIKDAELAEYFIEALGDNTWEVRAVAATALGGIVVPQAGEPLANAISDREWWVRQNAARSLLRYPDCESLMTAVLMKKDRYARDSIFHALDNADNVEFAERLRSIADVIDAEQAENQPNFGVMVETL